MLLKMPFSSATTGRDFFCGHSPKRKSRRLQERQNENIERFIRTADKYVDIEEIDPCMLRELIKAIYVEAPDKSSGKRRQKIHIEYDGIGFIPLEELAKKETA